PKPKRMYTFIEVLFDIPDKTIEMLLGFLRQGQGKLSQRARSREFKALTDEEAALPEDRYADIFSL
ncbi:cell filamentation protein Fic, partial [Planctomycetota bacterium]